MPLVLVPNSVGYLSLAETSLQKIFKHTIRRGGLYCIRGSATIELPLVWFDERPGHTNHVMSRGMAKIAAIWSSRGPRGRRMALGRSFRRPLAISNNGPKGILLRTGGSEFQSVAPNGHRSQPMARFTSN